MESFSLMHLFRGWDGYQQSLEATLLRLEPEDLSFLIDGNGRSVGGLFAHIAFGRLDWFLRMQAPGAAELAEAATGVWQPWQGEDPALHTDKAELQKWLALTWEMIDANLDRWTVEDLRWSYPQPYGGKVYAVDRQWVIWRVMAHDIHHGGQLAQMLALRGVALPELGDNGGHIIELPEMA